MVDKCIGGSGISMSHDMLLEEFKAAVWAGRDGQLESLQFFAHDINTRYEQRDLLYNHVVDLWLQGGHDDYGTAGDLLRVMLHIPSKSEQAILDCIRFVSQGRIPGRAADYCVFEIRSFISDIEEIVPSVLSSLNEIATACLQPFASNSAVSTSLPREACAPLELLPVICGLLLRHNIQRAVKEYKQTLVRILDAFLSALWPSSVFVAVANIAAELYPCFKRNHLSQLKNRLISAVSFVPSDEFAALIRLTSRLFDTSGEIMWLHVLRIIYANIPPSATHATEIILEQSISPMTASSTTVLIEDTCLRQLKSICEESYSDNSIFNTHIDYDDVPVVSLVDVKLLLLLSRMNRTNSELFAEAEIMEVLTNVASTSDLIAKYTCYRAIFVTILAVQLFQHHGVYSGINDTHPYFYRTCTNSSSSASVLRDGISELVHFVLFNSTYVGPTSWIATVRGAEMVCAALYLLFHTKSYQVAASAVAGLPASKEIDVDACHLFRSIILAVFGAISDCRSSVVMAIFRYYVVGCMHLYDMGLAGSSAHPVAKSTSTLRDIFAALCLKYTDAMLPLVPILQTHLHSLAILSIDDLNVMLRCVTPLLGSKELLGTVLTIYRKLLLSDESRKLVAIQSLVKLLRSVEPDAQLEIVSTITSVLKDKIAIQSTLYKELIIELGDDIKNSNELHVTAFVTMEDLLRKKLDNVVVAPLLEDAYSSAKARIDEKRIFDFHYDDAVIIEDVAGLVGVLYLIELKNNLRDASTASEVKTTFAEACSTLCGVILMREKNISGRTTFVSAKGPTSSLMDCISLLFDYITTAYVNPSGTAPINSKILIARGAVIVSVINTLLQLLYVVSFRNRNSASEDIRSSIIVLANIKQFIYDITSTGQSAVNNLRDPLQFETVMRSNVSSAAAYVDLEPFLQDITAAISISLPKTESIICNLVALHQILIIITYQLDAVPSVDVNRVCTTLCSIYLRLLAMTHETSVLENMLEIGSRCKIKRYERDVDDSDSESDCDRESSIIGAFKPLVRFYKRLPNALKTCLPYWSLAATIASSERQLRNDIWDYARGLLLSLRYVCLRDLDLIVKRQSSPLTRSAHSARVSVSCLYFASEFQLSINEGMPVRNFKAYVDLLNTLVSRSVPALDTTLSPFITTSESSPGALIYNSYCTLNASAPTSVCRALAHLYLLFSGETHDALATIKQLLSHLAAKYFESTSTTDKPSLGRIWTMGVRVSDAFLSELLHFTNNVISDVRDVRLSQLCCEISFFGVTATNNAESKEVLVFMLDKCSESNQRKFIVLQIKYLSTCLSEIAEVKKELSLMMKKRKLNTKTPQFESSDEDEERGTRRQCRKEETEEMFASHLKQLGNVGSRLLVLVDGLALKLRDVKNLIAKYRKNASVLSCFEERTLESIDALLSTSNVIYGELYKSKSATAVVPEVPTRLQRKKRLRSRNKVIDEWLEDEDGLDAYADLEDFLVIE